MPWWVKINIWWKLRVNFGSVADCNVKRILNGRLFKQMWPYCGTVKHIFVGGRLDHYWSRNRNIPSWALSHHPDESFCQPGPNNKQKQEWNLKHNAKFTSNDTFPQCCAHLVYPQSVTSKEVNTPFSNSFNSPGFNPNWRHSTDDIFKCTKRHQDVLILVAYANLQSNVDYDQPHDMTSPGAPFY